MSAGPLARIALAALAAAGALFAATARSRADEPALPADVEPSLGVAPWRPDPSVVGEEALEAWAERAAALAAASEGATRRSELLLSAAAALRPIPGRARRAASLALEAHNALPWQDPLAALALLETLELWLAAGAFEHARGGLARLRDWRALPGPVDADERAQRRFALATREARRRYPPLLAAYWEGLGRAGPAAEALVEAAEDPERRDGPLLWERIARLRLRSAQPDLARSAAERALAASEDPDLRARLSFWLLHLEQGLLRSDGTLGPAHGSEEQARLKPPGPEYVEALRSLAARLGGNPHLGGYLLAAGSSAFVLKAYEAALAAYRLALDDPHLRRAAWQDPGVVGGLLLAVEAALSLARLDEAEALLAEIESLAGAAIPQADGLRVRVRLARERRREREASAAAGPAPPAPRAPPRRTGELSVPPHPGGDRERHGDATDEPAAQDGGGLPWAGLAAGAAAALLVAALARRRRRPRG